jgi:hypothetical protein
MAHTIQSKVTQSPRARESSLNDPRSDQKSRVRSPLQFCRKTSSVHFRDLVARLYPGLDGNPAYWRFFGYLLFGSFLSKKTGRLVIGRAQLSAVEGQPTAHYHGERFLRAFQRDVMSPQTFMWSGWQRDGLCREVVTLEFHPELKDALFSEREKRWHETGRVYFFDGSCFSKTKQRRIRVDDKLAANARSVEVQCEAAREVLDYVNNLPPNLFTKLTLNLPKARIIAQQILEPSVRETQNRILDAIEEQPQPFYAPSRAGRTVRIFGAHECATSLKRCVRRALCHGLCEADLKSSQLAICGNLWKLPNVESFLRSRKDVWSHLADMVGADETLLPRIKPILKEGLYSVCFGMRRRGISWTMTQRLNQCGIENGGERFLNAPLIETLLAGRDRVSDEIRARGGAIDCFGKWLPFGPFEERDILAQTAQAVELQLLVPAINLARTTREFTILLWQHDGFTVHFARRRELWQARINEVVERQIKERGIVTELQWEDI